MVIVLVARSCGRTDPDISQERAIEIAKAQVAFEPNEVMIRYQRRGLNQREFWLVGLGIKRSDGSYERATNVLVDADTGAVEAVEDAVGGD